MRKYFDDMTVCESCECESSFFCWSFRFSFFSPAWWLYRSSNSCVFYAIYESDRRIFVNILLQTTKNLQFMQAYLYSLKYMLWIPPFNKQKSKMNNKSQTFPLSISERLFFNISKNKYIYIYIWTSSFRKRGKEKERKLTNLSVAFISLLQSFHASHVNLRFIFFSHFF